MSILSSDIRLLESERMTDNSDGGGRRTSRVIPDGVAGNIFPKVSRVDSVYGRVNLRKIYPHINTATLDVYAGAHFIITDAPDNDRIGVLAFSTGSDFDLRTAARDRIESYVIAGPVSRMTLYGRQLKGSQAVLIYQRKEEPLPEVGEVYALTTEAGGVTTAQQFVRAQDVAHEVRTFTDDGGDFERRIVTIKVGSPLRYEFQGVSTPSRLSGVSGGSTVRTTTVADAARYYGIKPLTAAVSSGALELTVTSVYAPIVPTTQRETALSLATVGEAYGLIPAADAEISRLTIIKDPYVAWGGTVYLGRAVTPGSLKLSVHHLGTEGLTYTVGVDGVVPYIPSPLGGGGYVFIGGSVNHETGEIRLPNTGSFDFLYVTYTPAAQVSQPAHTKALPVTLATRGTVYSVPLLPIPAPGTLIVDYRALGKWYRLRDNGVGELVGGDAAYGTGTVDYVTGGATITLGALPDVGSSVLLSWGSPAHYDVLAAAPVAGFETTLALTPVKPGTVVLTWDENGTPKTATDNGTGGFTGAATGTIAYQTGLLKIVMPKPIVGDVDIAYEQYTAPPVQPALGRVHDFGGAITPRTVLVDGASYTLPDGSVYTTVFIDDGAGSLVYSYSRWMGSKYALTSHIVGTVDYATGALELFEQVGVEGRGVWDVENRYWTSPPPGDVASITSVTAYSAALVSAGTGVTERSTVVAVGNEGSGLRLKVGNSLPRAIVPGSVMFTLGGKTHVDRNGAIYTDLDYATGSGRVVGSINYDTGDVTMSDYPSGVTTDITIQSCLAVKGSFTALDTAFRTAGSPIRPASLYIQCTALDGELLTGTTNASGIIAGAPTTVEYMGSVGAPGMTGTIEQTMGVVAVSFTKPVLPGTLRYSTVVLSNLPLDADILGLDPVRLPSDGRVPIYRPADVTVIHHTDIHDAGTPAPGEVINVGRTNLSALWLEDANKKKLASTMYAVDLAAGTATMAADLSLVGYVPPIAAKHRIEEMGLLSDVQINGQVTLTAPLLRDFPAGSLLSGALLYGDLQARATNLFDQQTWTGVWQSTVIGSGATAQFNDIDYPIEVLNNGAVTERWRLNFTSATAYQVIGENMGVIATGTTGTDLQPINQLTTLPYFTLRAAGWGAGWAVGNQLRFDTIAAAPPTWIVRTVLPGAALTGDSFDAQLRGDVD